MGMPFAFWQGLWTALGQFVVPSKWVYRRTDALDPSREGRKKERHALAGEMIKHEAADHNLTPLNPKTHFTPSIPEVGFRGVVFFI